MFIKDDINDYEGYDSDILITDGNNTLLCYFWGTCDAELKSGTIVKKITAFCYKKENLMHTECKAYVIKKDERDHYAYNLIGKLIDKKKKLIQIGGLVIEYLEHVGEDFKEGDFVEFRVDRLDCEI